jgi:hypothetical protein
MHVECVLIVVVHLKLKETVWIQSLVQKIEKALMHRVALPEVGGAEQGFRFNEVPS